MQAINMPKQGENILKFNNFHKQLPVPFVIYADFEAITKKVQGCKQINGVQAINMPKQGENIPKFNNFHKQLPVPFVIYADFEAITKKVQGCKQSAEMENEKNKRS